MISYELAKQLKDAGFPQNANECKHCGQNENWLLEKQDDAPHRPTLSELIEACGINSDTFLFTLVYEDQLGWRAGIEIHPHERRKNRFYLGYGQTPDEAVAKLWLVLNPNNAQERPQA